MFLRAGNVAGLAAKPARICGALALYLPMKRPAVSIALAE
jgi:hypothetical protein